MKQAFKEYFISHQDYYTNTVILYLEADRETREATKAHWLKCHAENMKADRHDLIMFSGKHLEAIMTAEAILAEHS